jgi:hypothetical protein
MFRPLWGHHQVKQTFLITELLLSIWIHIYLFIHLLRILLLVKHLLQTQSISYLKLAQIKFSLSIRDKQLKSTLK